MEGKEPLFNAYILQKKTKSYYLWNINKEKERKGIFTHVLIIFYTNYTHARHFTYSSLFDLLIF
jgi:hypothetical protein